nr:DUF5935 domain-containing protein [Neoroseomonas alba]
MFILLVWSVLIALGLSAPFVLGLAYIWVDLFRPQDVVPVVGQLISISMITAVLAVGMYLVADRRDPPRLGLLTVLMMVWAGWITLTTTWALFPQDAWWKWDWAFKTVVFTALLPFVFRSRIQIEAALMVLLCAVAAHVLPYSIKGLISGGAYDRPLGLIAINAHWGGEGSTLATYAFACLPLVAYLQRHSLIAPATGIMRYVYMAAPLLALAGSFATFARAAVIACLVWAALTWWQSRRKSLLAVAFVAAAIAIVPLMGERWVARISTTLEPSQEESAHTRLIVWGWTIDFANQHPAGGGFNAYHANFIVTPGPDGVDIITEARAFHSVYFEILGEHGWIGLGIFAALLAVMFFDMWRVRRASRGDPELEWLGDLARALSHAMLIFMAGGAFVGIAFYPLHYYLFAFAVCARAALQRARRGVAVAPAATDPGADPAVAASRHLPAWRIRAAGTKDPARRTAHGQG